MNDLERHAHAQRVLTPKEYAIWKLHDTGLSTRRISLALNLSRWTIRDQLENAKRKLREEETAA